MGEVSRGARALVVCPDIRGMAYIEILGMFDGCPARFSLALCG